ncbi:acetyl-CoA carboxylase biotin carboxyl carrier protein subunit [Pedobacter aquatilis]|uniref:acetyl-CoA carboxylase biotin carboxyl carrier protein subunit n=1 Tax=Pedobacter aquatilis TaxID=351343 RepID=UPI0025B3B1C1|nr:acetyl-CoA carboxylase biotin carboxyl carrier protein subunit [Pedobacter aquatilis]MDN3587349.1 acetyl-CoA carboxylase biotin carboxyl carrier protein subunit [Pedobacter aquatilis]
MFKIKVNDNFQFDVEEKSNEFFVDGSKLNVNLSTTAPNTASIILNNKSFNTEVIDFNKVEKTCTIKVNGNNYTLKVEDKFYQLLKQLGLDNIASAKIAEIKAPMPGLVLDIIVEEGTEVKKGDNLLILEAMKMENIIKSPADGVVKKLSIIKGDKVEKNQVLLQFK